MGDGILFGLFAVEAICGAIRPTLAQATTTVSPGAPASLVRQIR